jgi:hypothetical protein
MITIPRPSQYPTAQQNCNSFLPTDQIRATLTPRGIILFETLLVAQLITKSDAFYITRGLTTVRTWPCRTVWVHRRFGGPHCFRYQGDDNQDPDDGGSDNLWNVGKLIPVNTALQPRRQPSSYSQPWEPQILLFTTVSGPYDESNEFSAQPQLYLRFNLILSHPRLGKEIALAFKFKTSVTQDVLPTKQSFIWCR